MAIWRSKKYLRSKNVGDTQPIYSRQTTAIRGNYRFEVRQKLKETLKNPSSFIRCLSYEDFKSHPGERKSILPEHYEGSYRDKPR
jgi:hypothetical protein